MMFRKAIGRGLYLAMEESGRCSFLLPGGSGSGAGFFPAPRGSPFGFMLYPGHSRKSGQLYLYGSLESSRLRSATVSALLTNWFSAPFHRVIVVAVCCGLLIASGCRQRAPEIHDDPAGPAPVERVVKPDPAPPKPVSEPVHEPLRIAVLVSSDQPEYENVRAALARIAGEANVSIYSLDGQPASAPGVINDISESGYENVVAIGLLAARATRQLDTAKVVFCQVFNYQDHDLLSGTRHGVETITDVGPAIDVWSRVDPGLKTIGVITGPGHEARIEYARSTLAARGVTLVHRVTGTDKETVLEFQRIVATIDGYWLFPDNRVLSSSAIREIMSLARRSNVGVLTNDPRFHEIGAFICAAHDPAEIAECTYAMLETSRDSTTFSGASMSPLKNCVITIRADVATQLGYATDTIPSELLAR
jgi:ABC-type uncharacterized transport system substrate-binding protein